MSATKAPVSHTPGPWYTDGKYGRLDDGIVILCTADRTAETPEGYTYHAAIVPAFSTPSEEQIANARLIAAAPDLFAACKGLIDRIKIAGWHESTIEEAVAAIAKATQ